MIKVLHINYLLIMFIFSSFTIFADILQDTTFDYDQLKSPTSPGFVIIGSTPTTISRPESPNDISISIHSLMNEKNFGIEISPYKLFKDTTTFKDLYKSCVLKTLLNNLTISVASIETNKFDSLLNGKTYGVGFRTKLFDGKPNHELNIFYENKEFKQSQMTFNLISILESKNYKHLKELKDSLNLTNSLNQELIEMIEKRNITQEKKVIEKEMVEIGLEFIKIKLNNTEDSVTIKDFLESLEDSNGLNISKIISDIRKVNKKKVGFFLELAGAMAINMPDGDNFTLDIRKNALWITPSYRLEFSNESSSYFDVLGVGRYICDKRIDLAYFDYGIRLLYEYKSINFSFDFIKRTSEENDFRFMGMFEHFLNKEISVFFNFGKDFINPVEKNRNKFEIGINYGLGTLKFN